MIIRALFAFLLVDFVFSNPVREQNDGGKYGYNYDVKHPKGSSRVHVRTGGSGGRNHYPNRASGFPGDDYTSAESYVNPHYVGPSYEPARHGYSRNYHQEPLRKAPVYEEHWKPNAYQQTPSYQQYPTHNRGSYGFHPNEHVVSQTAVDAGPFHDPTYSNPHPVQQQVSVDEPIHDFQPNKLEQSSVELVDQSPIDQQVFVEEPEEIPVVLQEPLEEKPVLSQVIEDVPSVKTVPVEAPIVQQATLDEKVSQIAVEPSHDEPPIVQQVSDEVPLHNIKQAPFDDTAKTSPIVQTAISEHPSQAIYDSSVEPSFSDIDRHRPSHLQYGKPSYQFIPVGRPYQKISHSTEIIHGPPRSHYYPPRTFPQKYIKNRYPVVKNPPISYPVKYSPPPLPITKTLPHIGPKYAQVHTDKRIFTKHPPAYQSIKLPPPPPVHSVKLPPPPPVHSVKLPPPPPVHSVKLPPPPPVHSVKLPPPPVHSVKLPPPPPVHSVKLPPPPVHSVKLPPPPPVHSVKLPPPPVTKTIIPVDLPQQQEHVDTHVPVTKTVVPVELSQQQEHIDTHILPPAPVTKTVVPVELSQQQEHVDTDIPSVKLPPPAPVTKTVVPVDLSQQQEHVGADLSLEKNPHSIKLPPPPPVTKTVVSVPNQQEHVDGDIILTKSPPPPPAPITKIISQSELPHSQEYNEPDVLSVKSPSPVTKTVIPQVQESVDADLLSVKYPPISHSIKQPPPPVTKSVVPIHGLKTPYHPIPQVKGPHYGHKSPGASYGKLPSVASHFSKPHYSHPQPPVSHSIKYPQPAPPVLENSKPYYENPQLHLEAPSVKTVPKPHSVKYPAISSVKHPESVSGSGLSHVNPHFSALSDIHDSKSVPLSYSDEQPHSEFSHHGTDVEDLPPKYPLHGAPPKKYSPTAHGPKDSYSDYGEGINSNIPPSVHFDEPANEKSPFDKYPPVSHAVRLPSVILSPDHSSSSVTDLKPSTLDTDKPSTSDNHPPVSHAFRLTPPKTTFVPNLFKAVPSSPTTSDEDDETELIPPKSEALVSPISHSVRLPIVREYSNKPKEDFPAFPVESAYKQRDPVSEKVAELTNSFTPGEGYDSERRPHADDNNSDSPSIEEAKAEIERLNEEIGIPFGDRLRRSRYSRSRFS